VPFAGELSALGCALTWSIATLFVRHESHRASVVWLNAFATTAAASYLAVLLPLLAFLGFHTYRFDEQWLIGVGLLLVATALSVGLGDNFYFLALQRIGVPRAMPIANAEPLLATLLAVTLLGESVTPGLVIGLFLIPPGLYLVALPARGRIVEPKADARATRVGLTMAVAAAVFWALNAVTLRPALQYVDPLSATEIRLAGGAVLLWLIASGTQKRIPEQHRGRPRIWVAMVTGALTCSSTIFFSLAVNFAGAARAATLVSTSPIFAVPLAVLLLREQVSRRMVLGTAMTVLGLMCVVGF
jgi:DME family drug/metabolite transporter